MGLNPTKDKAGGGKEEMRDVILNPIKTTLKGVVPFSLESFWWEILPTSDINKNSCIWQQTWIYVPERLLVGMCQPDIPKRLFGSTA